MALTINERREAVRMLTAEGLPEAITNKLLRLGATLHRLAEAQCNGDYPADNGQRPVKFCTRCEAGFVPSVMDTNGVCPDCRAQDRAKALIAQFPGFNVTFGGDPRGCVLLVTTPNGKYNDWGQRGIVVG
jgi:hypothetical protein